MKFTLSRQILTEDMAKAIAREMKKQGEKISKVSKASLKKLQKICMIIESKGLPDHLVCKKLPYKLGHGIFLRTDAKPILKGEVIAFYAGEVSIVPQNVPDNASYAFAPLYDMNLSREEQKNWDKTRKYHPRRMYSVKLDALKKGNFTRFINHSGKPNIIAYSVAVPKNPYGLECSPIEILYVAKKKILPGEQLLSCYEYGEESYWKVSKIKPFPMTPTTFLVDSDLKIYEN